MLQWFSKPDLYVEVTCGESVARTPSATNTIDPTFEDPLFIYPNYPRTSSLPKDVPPIVVRVYDDDSSVFEKVSPIQTALERYGNPDTGDDSLGKAIIELGPRWEMKGSQEHKVRCPCSAHIFSHLARHLKPPCALLCAVLCLHSSRKCINLSSELNS